MKKPGHIYRLAYTTNPGHDDPKLFKCRDGIAFAEVNAVIGNSRLRYEETVVLHPNDRRGFSEGYPRFSPSDLLVLTTRPPLDDKGGVRKKIPRNNGPLEDEILDVVCRKYFQYCTRRFVHLADAASALIEPKSERRHWHNVEFFENHQTDHKQEFRTQVAPRRRWAALIKKHHLSLDQQEPPRRGIESSVGYLIRDRLPTLGCEVIISFGMDGDFTLIWNHLVRRKHPEWFQFPGFIMAELILKKAQSKQSWPPITVSFADDLFDIRVLVAAKPL